MRNNVRLLVIFLTLVAIPLSAICQEDISVKGKVITNNKFPLVNAMVKVKSSGKVFMTDSIGNFELKCAPNDKLVFNANGFTKKTEKVSGAIEGMLVDMKLKAGDANLDLAIGSEGPIREQDRDVMFKMNNTEEDFRTFTYL